MKNLIIGFSLLFCINLFSQQNTAKNDIIVTQDGQLLQVTVTKVTEEAISFNYPGESVVNEVKTNGIEKIVFASGRTQNFSGGSTGTSIYGQGDNAALSLNEPKPPAPPRYKENSLSIVPLDFKRNGAYDKTLAGTATDFMVGLMAGKASTKGIEVLEMEKAIEKLVDGGVNYDKLRQSSPVQLRDVLGTEYVLYVSIDENDKDPVSDVETLTERSKASKQLDRNINIRLYGASSEVEAFEVDFYENVYMDKSGNNSSLLSSGKWKSSLRYLVEQLYASNIFSDN